MKTRISALVDGELEEHEIRETLRALHGSNELRTMWSDAQVIGSALRRDGGAGFDVASQVMSALEREPTVLAPVSRRSDWMRPALALAASAAGIALVSVLALGPVAESSPGLVAAGPVDASINTRDRETPATVDVASASSRRMREYLVAHQAYAPGSDIVGGARHIRTVAIASEGRKE